MLCLAFLKREKKKTSYGVPMFLKSISALHVGRIIYFQMLWAQINKHVPYLTFNFVRHAGSNSYPREANHYKIVPASPEEDISRVSEIQQTAFPPSNNELTNKPSPDGGTHGNKPVNADDNRNCLSSTTKGKNKKMTLCCLHFITG